MLAVLLPMNIQSFPIEQENSAWCMRIRKHNSRQIMMKMLQNRDVALLACCPNPAIGTAIKDVTIVKSRGTFSAPAFHSERVLASIALPSSTTPRNDVV